MSKPTSKHLCHLYLFSPDMFMNSHSVLFGINSHFNKYKFCILKIAKYFPLAIKGQSWLISDELIETYFTLILSVDHLQIELVKDLWCDMCSWTYSHKLTWLKVKMASKELSPQTISEYLLYGWHWAVYCTYQFCFLVRFQ